MQAYDNSSKKHTQVYNEELFPLGILVEAIREDMSNFVQGALWGPQHRQRPKPPSVVLDALNGYVASLGVVQV
jgi:hypothetical protein